MAGQYQQSISPICLWLDYFVSFEGFLQQLFMIHSIDVYGFKLFYVQSCCSI